MSNKKLCFKTVRMRNEKRVFFLMHRNLNEYQEERKNKNGLGVNCMISLIHIRGKTKIIFLKM